MPSSDKVTLQVENPDGTSKAFELTQHDTFLFGRMADCHLCLPDDSQISRHHFLLEACPPQASLRDLGSMNGTHVSGKKCGGREKGESPEQGAQRQYPNVDLQHGDRITVGKSTIQVRIEAAQIAPGVRQVNAALPEGDLSGLSPEAMHQLIFGKPGQAAFQLKGYAIQRELGRGGCGAVYLATPQRGGGKVAVKIMLSRVQADTKAVDQFKREMAVIAKLEHPNIVRFIDSGSDEGTFFFRATTASTPTPSRTPSFRRPSPRRRPPPSMPAKRTGSIDIKECGSPAHILPLLFSVSAFRISAFISRPPSALSTTKPPPLLKPPLLKIDKCQKTSKLPS